MWTSFIVNITFIVNRVLKEAWTNYFVIVAHKISSSFSSILWCAKIFVQLFYNYYACNVYEPIFHLKASCKICTLKSNLTQHRTILGAENALYIYLILILILYYIILRFKVGFGIRFYFFMFWWKSSPMFPKAVFIWSNTAKP